MKHPQVSVLLNVFNGQDYIGTCIDSVLAQTFEDFEFIIIDDGSTDKTTQIIAAYEDKRIRLISQPNSGIADSANLGIALARAPLIARIDHDDVMMPERLETQLAAMQAQPEAALACAAAQLIIDDRDSQQFYRVPLSARALKLRLLFDNPVVQSTVMMKTSAVRELGGYIKRPLPFPEDFHLWVRMAHEHPVITIAEPLTKYRVRPGSASYGNRSPRFNVEVSANSLHLYLAPHYSWAECEALAAIFHRMSGPFAPLSMSKGLAMLEKAAMLISGPKANWDSEFRANYQMQRRVIRVHSLARRGALAFLTQKLPFLSLRE